MQINVYVRRGIVVDLYSEWNTSWQNVERQNLVHLLETAKIKFHD